MKKKLLLILTIITVLASTIAVSAAIDESDVNYFLEKIATTQDDQKRELGVYVLREFMDKDEPDLDGLKFFLEHNATADDIKTIENAGYTMNEAINSLDIMEDMTREVIINLISAIENKDLESMRQITKQHNDEEAPPVSGGGGGGTVTPVEEVPEPVTEPLVEIKFKDITSHWANGDIKFLAERKIISGYSEEEFAPNKNINRAEVTTLIVNLMDLKSNDNMDINFKDITSEDWYYDYIKIAKQNGLISGTSENTFSPKSFITREQMVVITVNALEQMGKIDNTDTSDYIQALNNYSDTNSISSWATESFGNAIKIGIIKGRSDTLLAPGENLTRGEAATIIKIVYDIKNN